MKKLISIVLVVCTLLCVVGCESEETEKKEKKQEDRVTFLAEIVEINGESVLVEPLEGEQERNSADWISFSTDGLRDLGAVEGDIVKITYDGLIMESYPAQIRASKWKIHEKACQGTDPDIPVDEKPVIYFYPERETRVSVKLTVDGVLTCTYPAYRDGWEVTAMPDGTLTDETGMTYNYLYWEAVSNAKYDFHQGFCVKGEDTAAFLEDALQKLGLNRREANEFIVYWLPRMEQNPYNIIAFQTDAYTQSAKLEIAPQPDTLIRVFMAYKPSESYVQMQPQELSSPQRTGFTVIEWGGAEV